MATNRDPVILFVVHGADSREDEKVHLLTRRAEDFVSGLTDRLSTQPMRAVVPPWRQSVDIRLGTVHDALPTPDGLSGNRLASWLDDKVRWGRAAANALAGRRAQAVTILGRRYRLQAVAKMAGLLGDVLSYGRHRAQIHDYIASQLGALQQSNIVAVGHSLGGIILADLLADGRREFPHVKVLVTFGSQASIMYLLDALDGLPLPRNAAHGPPRPRVPWVNIFDRNDLLSFVAYPVFGGRGDDLATVDIEINSQRPFPDAHGEAYWDQPGTVKALAIAALFAGGLFRLIPSGTWTESMLEDWIDAQVARSEQKMRDLAEEMATAARRLDAEHRALLERVEALMADLERQQRTREPSPEAAREVHTDGRMETGTED